MGTKDDFEPYWRDEKDWLCIVEFLPTDNAEARLFAADIIGYLGGYANLTNTRSLALLGDPDATAGRSDKESVFVGNRTIASMGGLMVVTYAPR